MKRAGVIVWAVVLLVCLGGPFVRFGDRAFAPWARNFVTRWGVSLPNETLIGTRAQTLPFVVWAVLSLTVYVLLVLPAVTIPVLLLHQRRVGPALSRWAWGTLAVFGVYSVATTHDYLAMSRARLQATSALIAAGVPRTQIVAGVEFDGWTQIEAHGYVNDPRIVVPPGAYHPRGADGEMGQADDIFWFLPWTPAITPRYVIALSPSQSLLPSSFAPVRYARWLALGGDDPPPAEVVTQRVPADVPTQR